MLEGITILNQTEIMGNPKWLMPTVLIGFLVLFIGVGVLVTFLSDSDPLGIFVGIVLGVLYTAILIGCWSDTMPTGCYKYEALIDESVSFEAVLEKYDVVEQKGKIWILEDKEKMSE